MQRLRAWFSALTGSLWFLPAVMVCASIGLAIGLVELEVVATDLGLAHDWPRLFGAGAEGARSMLSAIATSMITVAGVVFSITIVALSLTASQYSPRVLRTFMSDRPTQVALGTFVSVFAYCLAVLRTIRSPQEGGFVPSIAVLGGVMMAMLGVALLIYFVHHVATAIQVSTILERIGDDTARAIDRLFPSGLGVPAPPDAAAANDALPTPADVVAAPRTGYLVSVDGARLLELAAAHALVVRIEAHVGDFVVEGQPLMWLHASRPVADPVRASLQQGVRLERERNIDQDAPYGVQQIVDIALKALSPGIHDPTTATHCIDRLGALMARLATRAFESPYRWRDGALRAVIAGPGFGDFVGLAFAAIAEHAGDHTEVHERLVHTFSRLERATLQPQRRDALARQVQALGECTARAGLPPARAAQLDAELRRLRQRLSSAGPTARETAARH